MSIIRGLVRLGVVASAVWAIAAGVWLAVSFYQLRTESIQVFLESANEEQWRVVGQYGKFSTCSLEVKEDKDTKLTFAKATAGTKCTVRAGRASALVFGPIILAWVLVSGSWLAVVWVRAGFKGASLSTSPTIRCISPSALSRDELGDFEALVLAGGEVDAQGLTQRITQAARICDAHMGKCLVAVSGLKKPEHGYRSKISEKSKVSLNEEQYPFELGWVYVLPSARRNNLSRLVCEPLVTSAERNGIFATSYVENTYMHRTLEKLGFARTGDEWVSSRSDRKLCLFLRQAV